MDAQRLTSALQDEARRLGFGPMGVCPAVEPTGFSRLREWLDAGFGGSMHYLEDRYQAYQHPRHVLAGVRSIVVLAQRYRTVEPPTAVPPGFGRISRYAWGTDYHDLLHDRLKQLAAFVRAARPEAKVRGVVDSAPLLEREFAQLAGLGWIGKHTLLLNREVGSWFFLCALLTDQELVPDAATETDHCGTCTACLDACPTDAFVAPYVLDARKCLSYTTIELREAIPLELRAAHGDWVFGCDVCQDVCPWNRKAPSIEEPELAPREGTAPLDLIALFDLDEASFRKRFRGTPLWRAKRRGLLRNAAIVLGNQRAVQAVPALQKGTTDEEPLIREACAWALQQIRSVGV
jgi:epoxyqueuosine reductase